MKLNRMGNLSGKASVAFFLVFAIALTFISRDAVSTMVQSWQQEEYSHGYLIPLLSLVMFLNRGAKATFTPRTAWAGTLIVTLGILAQFGVQFAGINGVSPELYLVSFIGMIALFWGTQSLRVWAAPLALLFFCAPLPKFMFYTLSFDMQMLSSSLGTKILMLLDVPVFQDGNIIDLGGYQLQVAEACSGIRYLFPLMGLSFLLATMYKTTFWKRALVFVSAIPIAIFMNGLRIAVIGITVDRWGQAMAEGLLHEFEGWIVFAGCTVLLLLEVTLLQKFGNRGSLNFDDLRIPSLKNVPAPALGTSTWVCATVLCASVTISIILPPFLENYLKPIPLQQPMASFPLQLGDWAGQPQTMDAKSQAILGTSEYFIGDYTHNNEPTVNIYMLYYPQQDSTSNQAIHSPSICVPAGGWTVDQKTISPLILDKAQQLTVNKMLISKGREKEIVYYWFVQDGTPVWSPNLSKFVQIRNAITTGRTDGAMIRIVTRVSDNETEQAAEQRMLAFMNNALPVANAFLFPQSIGAVAPHATDNAPKD